MDRHHFNNLSQDSKRILWQRLSENPDFLALKHVFEEAARVNVKIKNMSSKEAFIYESIRAQALLEVVNYPQAQLDARSRYDK